MILQIPSSREPSDGILLFSLLFCRLEDETNQFKLLLYYKLFTSQVTYLESWAQQLDDRFVEDAG